MAVSAIETSNIIKLATGLMREAPCPTFRADLITCYEANGRSLLNLARMLANTTAFRALNPKSQTAAEFAIAILAPFDLQQNAIALNFVQSRFDEGVCKGEIVYSVLVAIDSGRGPQFKAARDILNQLTASTPVQAAGYAARNSAAGSPLHLTSIIPAF